MEWMWNRFSVRRRSGRTRQEFPRGVFLGLYVESLLSEKKDRSRHARLMVWKGHNFLSNSSIAIKILQEFSDALFHIVDVESILSEDEVWSR